MTRATRIGLALGLLFAGLMVMGSLSTGLVSAATTYSVTFTEIGVPSGTSWSVYFNGVTYTPTTPTLTITGVSSGSYYWYFSAVSGTTGVNYATTGLTAAYMTVPTQLTQTVVYQKQFSVGFVVTPPGSGFTNPGYTSWMNAGSKVPITASHYTGYTFVSWRVPHSVGFVTNTHSAATLLTVNGTGSIAVTMKSLSTSASFNEIGLPSGTTWSVFFSGASYSSSTSTVAVGSHSVGGQGWSIAAVSGSTGVEYVASPSSGSMSMPYLGAQTIVFTKEDQLTFAVTPTGGGSTAPTTAYYPDGVALPVTATASSGYKFTSWSSASSSVTFQNTTHGATTVTATGPATITAHFATGTTCTKCTATFYANVDLYSASMFYALGLPAGTTWSVTIGGVQYYSKTTTMVFTGVTAAFSFSVPSYLVGPTGTSYQPDPVSSYFNVPYQNAVVLQFQTYYLISFPQSPYSVASTSPYYGGWYPAGSMFALTAWGNDAWNFKSWSSSSKTLSIASKSAADTYVTVGSWGSITATFVSPTKTVEFVQAGLPAGTTWSLVFNSATYYSSGWDLNVSVPAVQYSYWSIAGPLAASSYGTQYAAWFTSGSITPTYVPVVQLYFVEQFLVTFVAGGVTGGSVAPSSAAYYNTGTLLAIEAYNSTSVHFKTWGSTGGPFTIGQPTWATTTVAIGGTGNVTATFK
ncbi:MAG: hypothetical protein L3K19_02455 [Thermoplasmata archaeon]|nr:hypothetical protein [Thermoplasmata archaeon]